jgi:hypothetical protein
MRHTGQEIKLVHRSNPQRLAFTLISNAQRKSQTLAQSAKHFFKLGTGLGA